MGADSCDLLLLRRLFANLLGLTAVACSNLFMGGPPTAGGSQPVPQADPSEVLTGVALTILSQFIGVRLANVLLSASPCSLCLTTADGSSTVLD